MLPAIVFVVVLIAPFVGLMIYSYVDDLRDEQRYQEEQTIRWALEERRPPEEVARVIVDYERRYKRSLTIVSAGTSGSKAVIISRKR